MSPMGTRHVRYFMTPAGLEALGRATRASMANTVHLYTETREHIRASLTELSQRCVADANGEKRVVFYGAGDVAEIAYVSLQRTDLTLVGVVDDKRRGKFFDFDISDPSALTCETIGVQPYSRLIVASIRPNVIDAIHARVTARGISLDRVSS